MARTSAAPSLFRSTVKVAVPQAKSIAAGPLDPGTMLDEHAADEPCRMIGRDHLVGSAVLGHGLGPRHLEQRHGATIRNQRLVVDPALEELGG